MRDEQEFNIKFVTLVEAYPCLYDNSREDYHLSHIQERAWAKIAKDIGEGATIADCKKRWKNLRGSYTKHLKTYVPSGSGASVKRPYYLSEYICFVLPFTKSRQPKGNVEGRRNTETAETLDEETTTEDFETEDLGQLGSPNEIENFKNNVGRKNNSDDEQSITEEVHQHVSDVTLTQQDSLVKDDSRNLKVGKQKGLSSTSLLSENKRKRKKPTQNQVTLDDVNKSAFEYFERKKQTPALTTDDGDDADKLFLLSLLPDLKKMTDKQKRKYKVEILNLAGEILDEPQVSHNSAPLFSPTSSDSSLVMQSMPSSHSSATYNNSVPPFPETADLQPTYQDISLPTVHPPPTQDNFSKYIQYLSK